MAKRKKKRPGQAKKASALKSWLKEVLVPLPDEELRGKVKQAARESADLIDEIEFKPGPLDGQRTLNALLEDLAWYEEKLLSDDEQVKWWFCHQVRQNVIGIAFTPMTRHLTVGLLGQCKERTFRAGERDKVLSCHFSEQYLARPDATLEVWGLTRAALRQCREGVELPEDTTDGVRQCLAVFEEYEQMGERDPFLRWAEDGYPRPSPNPYELDEGTDERILELGAAIQKGEVPVQVLDARPLSEIYQEVGLAYLGLVGQSEGAAGYEMRHQTMSELGKRARQHLAELYGTPKWENLRTDLSVVASNAALARELDQRRWERHWRDCLATLDHYDRGNHPVLRSIFSHQIARMHESNMRAMARAMQENQQAKREAE